MSLRRSWVCLVGACYLASGCGESPRVDATIQAVGCILHDDCEDHTECNRATGTCQPLLPTRDVDILFLIDNSPSMALKQSALARSIPAFMKRIDDSGADYHVGIATSDVGSTTARTAIWGGNIGSCDTYEGDDGVLRVAPCTDLSNGTSQARQACGMLCPDRKFVPRDGTRFISKIKGVTNVPSDLQIDPMTGKKIDLGPVRAFSCMALVGDGGCGIEGQFEGARRALDGHRSENNGFLRRNSMLAIIFITDEDDCSVKLSARRENNPESIDCSTPDKNASYQCFNIDYRCLGANIECDEPMNTAGSKHDCKERAKSYLFPIDEYVRFFSSLRPRARFLIGGIWTLPALDKGGLLSVSLGSGGTASPFLNRDRAVCANPEVAGMPQLRLSKLAARYPGSIEVNLCDVDKYPDALDKIAAAIVEKIDLAPPG